MARQPITLGSAPDGTGGMTSRAAWTAAEANFEELYDATDADVTVAGGAKEIWLAADRATGGTGSRISPYSASTAAKLKDVWNANTLAGTVFRYLPGTYETLGFLSGDASRQTIRSDQAHIGSGPFATELKLIEAAVLNDGTIFSNNSRTDRWRIAEMTLNCNGDNLPKKGLGLGSATGINAAGSNIRVEDVRVIGFGSFQSGSECFPVIIYGGAAQAYDNILIRGCSFELPASGNVDGLSCIAAGANTDTGATAHNVRVEDCTFKVAPGVFGYAHGAGAPIVRNCHFDIETGIYMELTSGVFNHHLWENNVFRVPTGGRGVDILIGPDTVRGVTIRNNVFQFSHGSALTGVSARDASEGGLITNLLVRNNLFERDSGITLSGTQGVLISGTNGAKVLDNDFDMGLSGGDAGKEIVFGINVTNQTVAGNREAGGTTVT